MLQNVKCTEHIREEVLRIRTFRAVSAKKCNLISQFFESILGSKSDSLNQQIQENQRIVTALGEREREIEAIWKERGGP